MSDALLRRNRLELDAWQMIEEIMPSNRSEKTRSAQFDILKILFDHLYKPIPLSVIEEKLISIGKFGKGDTFLRTTLNHAIYLLEENKIPFEIHKIQDSQNNRYAQMDFTGTTKAPLNIEELKNYLTEIIAGIQDASLKRISIRPQYLADPLEIEDKYRRVLHQFLADNSTECISNNPYRITQPDYWIPGNQTQYFFTAEAPAAINILLLYDVPNPTIKDWPFLGFMANTAVAGKFSDSRIDAFRGFGRESEILQSLHRWFYELKAKSLTHEEARQVASKAQEMLQDGEVISYHRKFRQDQDWNFVLTRDSWARLKAQGVTERILEQLQALEYQIFNTKAEFLAAIFSQIGETEANNYQASILQHIEEATIQTALIQQFISQEIRRKFQQALQK